MKTASETEHSKALFQKAKTIMPGGVTANIKYFSPQPIFMKKGKGAYLTDVDNHEYIDYLLSYSALILGHGDEKIQEAMTEYMNQYATWLLGAPNELEIKFGQAIKRYYPSIDKLRYTNSGTEATLLALRLAKAHTGKSKIAKFEGHYHGGHKQVLFSVHPNDDDIEGFYNPLSVPESKELNHQDSTETIVLPFNQLEETKKILSAHQDEISALILEPIQDGFIPGQAHFMREIRQLTKDLNIILIYDEVKTGFRVDMGGGQALYNVEPDLTTLGKVIGGGFPIGIVGGREDIMMHSSPINTTGQPYLNPDESLFHSGTYNGHPMTLAIGLATFAILESELANIFFYTSELKDALEALFHEKSIATQILGKGSMFNFVFSEDPIHNYRDYKHSNLKLRQQLDAALLKAGVYAKPGARYSLSTKHKEREIDQTIEAFKKALETI